MKGIGVACEANLPPGHNARPIRISWSKKAVIKTRDCRKVRDLGTGCRSLSSILEPVGREAQTKRSEMMRKTRSLPRAPLLRVSRNCRTEAQNSVGSDAHSHCARVPAFAPRGDERLPSKYCVSRSRIKQSKKGNGLRHAPNLRRIVARQRERVEERGEMAAIG
jgi:hypothetical protein